MREARDPIEKWWIRMLSGWLAVRQLAVIDREIFEARVGGLDEDLRLVAGGAQHALDAEHLVADGVAVAERGEDLMNRRRHGLGCAAGAADGRRDADVAGWRLAAASRDVRERSPSPVAAAGLADAGAPPV